MCKWVYGLWVGDICGRDGGAKGSESEGDVCVVWELYGGCRRV